MSSRPIEKKQETDNSPNRRSEQLRGCADTMSREGLRALAVGDAGDRRRRVDSRGDRKTERRAARTKPRQRTRRGAAAWKRRLTEDER
ncbi:hypothetical protein ERJ75_001113600 [Trypanosoma vivax]|nr:hypothetical protein ERJ75_001113600 [Trypanosoma vivax]